jgi:DNA-binding NarL/FixJ family response regulator
VAKDTLKATSRQTKPPSVDGFEPLTERELHVLQLIESGYTNKQIAQEMIVSLNTVKFHLKNIYGKLGVDNRTQAARAFRKKD